MFLFQRTDQSFISSYITTVFLQLAGRKTLFLSYPAPFTKIGVKAQAACKIDLKCMTVRIIAMSNPLELQRGFFFFLMHDNCQGDKQAVTMENLNTCFPSSNIALKL